MVEDKFYAVINLHNTLHLIEAKAKRAKLTEKEINQVNNAVKKLEELKFVIAE
jgi:hypothetical protein